PDDEHARAQGFKILRREAEPEFLAGARQHERHEQQRGVPAQREELSNALEGDHDAKNRSCQNGLRGAESVAANIRTFMRWRILSLAATTLLTAQLAAETIHFDDVRKLPANWRPTAT